MMNRLCLREYTRRKIEFINTHSNEESEDCDYNKDGEDNEEDEYRWAGSYDPKIAITTSMDPSSNLRKFGKEVQLILPNSRQIKRRNYDLSQLVDACRTNEITDFILLTETFGEPDGMIVSHLPHWLTAYFTFHNNLSLEYNRRKSRVRDPQSSHA